MTIGDIRGAKTARRSVLFLQGPASSFFRRFGRAVAEAGHDVHRVNFHGGDQLFWGLPGAVNFRGRGAEWPDFVERLMIERGITDVVLFGDCRPRHRDAIAAANRRGIPVHVFEEGYVRPSWVTLELGGVNGHSSLPRESGWYREAASRLPPLDDAAPVKSSFARRAFEDVAYNVGYMLMGWSFPHYRTHRPWHPLVEYAGWGRRLLRRRVQRKRIAAEVSAVSALRDFYVFPLQLDCDYQVRLHSKTGGVASAIEQVLRSFAENAPAGTSLVVKEHPLDNGLRDWRGEVELVAARLGIAERVVYVEDGDLALMALAARGMVSINSTSGTQALAAGKPVMTLGRAVYDLPGLTFQGALDDFWTEAAPPDAELFEAFRRVLGARCLVRGGFFSDAACDMLVPAALARIEAGPWPVPHANAAASRGVAADRFGPLPAGGAAR